MLTGDKKRDYQREYMRDYMRKRRAEEYALQEAGLNGGSKQGLNTEYVRPKSQSVDPIAILDRRYIESIKLDADGNEIPEY